MSCPIASPKQPIPMRTCTWGYVAIRLLRYECSETAALSPLRSNATTSTIHAQVIPSRIQMTHVASQAANPGNDRRCQRIRRSISGPGTIMGAAQKRFPRCGQAVRQRFLALAYMQGISPPTTRGICCSSMIRAACWLLSDRSPPRHDATRIRSNAARNSALSIALKRIETKWPAACAKAGITIFGSLRGLPEGSFWHCHGHGYPRLDTGPTLPTIPSEEGTPAR